MIVDVKGKKLVFGLTWKHILGSGTLTDEAAKLAKELKSNRIWHEGRSQFVGIATGEDASPKVKETLYSGAIALGRGERKGLSTLFIYHLSASDEYIVCGLIQGKPQAAFDAVVATERDVASKVADYAQRCGSGLFVIAGNVDGLLDLVGTEQQEQVEALEMDLSTLAASADEPARLRSLKRASINPLWLFRGACGAAIVAAAVVMFCPSFPNLHLPFFHRDPPPKSPQELYEAALSSVVGTSVMPVSMLLTWADWWSDQPFVVGGWIQSDVACSAKTMPVTCVFTYEANSPAATNLTFDNAKPASWPQPNYAPDGKTIHVTLRVPGLKIAHISDLRKVAPTVNDLALNFGSILQEVRPISDRTNIGLPQVFPPGMDPSSLTHALYANTWEVNGPLRNIDVLNALPGYATITNLHLIVNFKVSPKDSQSKLMLDVSGFSFSRK